MTEIDEAMLIAWVDGELDEVSRRRVDRAVADDPALAVRLDLHRRLRARLADHYAPIAREPVPERMRAAMVVTPVARPATWGKWATGGAIAASMVLGLGIGHLSGGRAGQGGQGGPIAVRGGALVAQGVLATALDSQLASAQGGAPIRIGISFRRKGGAWCRSFEGAAVAGVACRDGGDWQVQQAVPGIAPGTDYRQAASGDARVMATVDALIAGDPANAAQEAAAQAGGWR